MHNASSYHPRSNMIPFKITSKIFFIILRINIIFLLSKQSYAFHFSNCIRPHPYHKIRKAKEEILPKYTPKSILLSTIDEYDDTEAKSQFGTKQYWDDMYNGLGDLPQEEYSWYYSFKDTIQPILAQH